MNLIKFLWKIITDERGITPLVAGAAILGGSSILGSVFGKKKKKEEIYDPYSAQRGQFTDYLGGRLGKQTPYTYNPEFELDQPEVERETEETILGKLRKPTDYVGANKDITERAYAARKARMQDTFAEEQTQLKDMYNRLGLVSSTPGLKAQTDLSRQQGLQLEDISAQLSYEDIAREMEAQKLADVSSQAWTGQGQVLGQQQRGYQQYGQQMSMEDLQRKLAEEQSYANMMGGLLSANPPERTVSYEPNIWSNLAGVGQDIGSQLMMSNILGNKGGTKTTGGGKANLDFDLSDYLDENVPWEYSGRGSRQYGSSGAGQRRI